MKKTRALGALPDLRALAALLLGVLAAGASPASADEIYAYEGNQLFRLDTDTGEQTFIGASALSRPTTLTFTPEGELIVTVEDGSFFSVDLESAALTEIDASPLDQPSFSSLAAAPGGIFYRQRSVFDPRRSRLSRLDLGTGEEKRIGFLHGDGDEDVGAEDVSSIAFRGGQLFALTRTVGPRPHLLLSVSPSTGAATRFMNLAGLGVIYSSLDFDSDGRAWVVSQELSAPPLINVLAFDPETGDRAPGAPAFRNFLGGLVMAIRPPAPPSCVPDESSLCLLGGRYRVTATFEDSQGTTGIGRPVPGDSDLTGLLWFFAADNWELMVKVIDGCENNDRVWVFVSGTTNVGYAVTVTDTVTGERRDYENPIGQQATTELDTDAFATCPGAS